MKKERDQREISFKISQRLNTNTQKVDLFLVSFQLTSVEFIVAAWGQ